MLSEHFNSQIKKKIMKPQKSLKANAKKNVLKTCGADKSALRFTLISHNLFVFLQNNA